MNRMAHRPSFAPGARILAITSLLASFGLAACDGGSGTPSDGGVDRRDGSGTVGST